MNDILYGIGVGFVFAFGGLLCLGALIGIGEIIEWFQRRNK